MLMQRRRLEFGHMMRPLLTQLQDLWFEARRSLDLTHHRTLPFADYIVDRWTRAEELGFGDGSSVYDSCLVIGDVRVGGDTWIGPHTVLDGSGGLTIGSHCAISAGAQIYSHSAVKRTTSGGEAPIERRATVIGDNTFIGPNAIVTMGVTIGSGVAIGANSYVDRDIPDGAQAFGTPCRVRRSVSESGSPSDPNP